MIIPVLSDTAAVVGHDGPVTVERAAANRWYVEAPDEFRGGAPSVYLAGGITRCPDWQSEAVSLLDGVPAVVLNPRRESFDVADPSATERQIRWEHAHLQRADVVLFWFSEGPSPQPIALYELGAMAAVGRRIVVGVHPAYSRRADVRLQMELSRPELVVHSDLERTVEAAVAALS